MDNSLGGAPDPMQTTPSPTSSATLPQQPTQAAPSTSAQPPTVVKPVPVVPPHVAKLAAFGQAFQTLAGTANSYSVDPSTGQTVATPQKQAPGQLWRNILASAIMGGASAQAAHNQNPNMGFGGGVVTGGAAGIQDARQQDLLKRQQAQQQFQNQQAADRNNREQDESTQRIQYMKAQTALANADTLQANIAAQGQDFDYHQKLAVAGKAAAQTYIDSGLKPVVDNVPEADMGQYIHDHPGSSSLHWYNTDTHVGVDANGNPTWQNTLTAFDPKGQVTIAKATLDQWKKDGVYDRYPEFASLKPGQQMPVGHFIALSKQAQQATNDNQARQTQNLSAELTQAKIRQANATTAHELTETSHVRQQISDDALGKKTSEQFGKALQDLDNAGGDFTKLKPSDRILIGNSMTKLLPGLNAEYKTILSDPSDPDAQTKATAVLQQIQSITKLGTEAIQGMTPKAGDSGGIPAGATTALDPTTHQVKAYTTDGGKTWVQVGNTAPAPKMVQMHGFGATISVPEDQVAKNLKQGFSIVQPTAPVSPTGPNGYNGR